MLDRHLHQATVFQASKRDRITTGLVVLSVHALLAAILLMDLTATVRYAAAEGPVMALLLPQKAQSRLPAPAALNVTIPNPRALAPEIAVTPEPRAETPAQTSSSAITVPPSPASDSPVTASITPGDDGAGAGGDGEASRSAGQAGAGGLDINDYLWRVAQHIQRFIPRGMPRGTPDQGLTYVYLHWTQNGSVVAKRVVQSSGDDWIDRSAILAITRAERLPPIPPEFKLPAIEGRIPILFSKR